MAELLIARGARLEYQDEQGRTPLFIAVEGNDPAMVSLLSPKGQPRPMQKPTMSEFLS